MPYRGIEVGAAEGVHDAVERLVAARYGHDERSAVKVLDLAAGNGALSQRLHDLGFRDITAWELEAEKFVPEHIVVERLDLNTRFAAGRDEYDLIAAVEILEHLENPFQFLREIATLLSPQGFLFLTTPNIESAVGRIQFLINGRYRWFDEVAYEEWGHIQPISTWQLEKMLAEAGLEVVERTANTPQNVLTVDQERKDLVKGLLAWTLSPIMRGNKHGDIIVWAIGKGPRASE